MHYLLSVWHDPNDGDVYATPEIQQAAFDATGKFNAEIVDSGHFVFGGGLQAPDTATVIDNTTGTIVTTDGPFAEAKEHLGGFWVIEAKDLDEAMAIAARGSQACRNAVEVRPFEGMA
jgi:hypothetical protein